MQSVVPKSGQKFIGETGAILDGARLLKSFRREGKFWIADDPDRPVPPRGFCTRGYSACSKPAGVYIDGRPLLQVAARDDVRPGNFFFDSSRHEIVIADDPAGKEVEAASAIHAFDGAADGVVIRNLIVEKYRNPAQTGAVNGAAGKGWRIEHSEIRLNAGSGANVGSDAQIRDCDIHHNGQLGAGGTGSNILLADNHVWANNTAMFDESWESGGIKIGAGTNVTFRGNRVHDNAGPGLWCDVDCRRVVFERNTVENNNDAGIFFEISDGATISDNILRENGRTRTSWFWGADIQVAASQNVLVCRNRITVRPDGRAIMLIDQNRAKDGGGYYETSHDLVCDNDIEFLGRGAAGGISDAIPGSHNFSIIENGGNRFVRNHYRYNPSLPPSFAWGSEELDFAAFRRLGQEDGGSLTIDTTPAGPKN